MWRCVLHGRVSSFFRPSESGVREFFGAAVLAGLGSFLGGVWLFRMGCRELGFWCGGAFCTVEFQISLGHQKVALESFFGAAVLAGLGSFLGGVWLFRICCGEVGFWCGGAFCLHGRGSSFFRPSESGVREFFGAAVLAGLGSFLGGVWLFRMGCREVGFWCGGAFCTVEVHLSLGHQKVALESFLGAAVLAGLGSFLGGVWLFRMGCREVGFWCGGAFCTVEFHLSLGHQKVALESFLALRFWLVWARF